MTSTKSEKEPGENSVWRKVQEDRGLLELKNMKKNFPLKVVYTAGFYLIFIT